jgi:hypothetical protein
MYKKKTGKKDRKPSDINTPDIIPVTGPSRINKKSSAK